jgi:hypothetical protein
MLAGSAPIGGHSMKNNIFIKNSIFFWGLPKLPWWKDICKI